MTDNSPWTELSRMKQQQVAADQEEDVLMSSDEDHLDNDSKSLIDHSKNGKEDSRATCSVLESDDEDDDITIFIRQEFPGAVLYAVFGLCMTLVSVSLLLLYYHPHQSVVESSRSNDHQTANLLPVWQTMLEYQIPVLQNLMHASLLGACATLVALRGDVVWVFFVRNVAFFWLPKALSYVLMDLYTISAEVEMDDSTMSIGLLELYGPRVVVAIVMAGTCALVLLYLEPMMWTVRGMVVDRVGIGFPRRRVGMAQTESDIFWADVIYYASGLLQVSAVLFSLVSFRQWFHRQGECSSTIGEDFSASMTAPEHLLMHLEHSYIEGAHEAFLLALIALAATYPCHAASVGGALLVSAWRLLSVMGYWIHLHIHWTASIRDHWSLIYILLEVAALIPIFVGSTILGMRCLRRLELNTSSPTVRAPVTLSQIAMSDSSCDTKDDGDDNRLCYTDQQRRGALLLWRGSQALLTEYTLESLILLGNLSVGSTIEQRVYKWGMHVVVIYVFCTIMSVPTPKVYRVTRMLLVVMCPVGSLLALRQFYQIISRVDREEQDLHSVTVAGLFLWRAVCGGVQTAGVSILKTTKPRGVAANSDDVETVLTSETSHEGVVPTPTESPLTSDRSRALRALFGFYLPAMIASVWFIAVHGNGNAAGLSPTIPAESCASSHAGEALLNQNWPAMSFFFHFGLVTVLFAADGLSFASFPSSLMIAELFAAHVALLISIHLSTDLVQNGIGGVHATLAQSMTLILWACTSAYLALSLHCYRKA